MYERFSKSSFDKGFMNVLFKDTQNMCSYCTIKLLRYSIGSLIPIITATV